MLSGLRLVIVFWGGIISNACERIYAKEKDIIPKKISSAKERLGCPGELCDSIPYDSIPY